MSKSISLRMWSKLLVPICVLVMFAAFALGAVPANAQGGTTYVVQPGDTLFGISTRYGINLYTLASLNNIYDVNTIYVGQLLTIPATSTYPVVQPPVYTYMPPVMYTPPTYHYPPTMYNPYQYYRPTMYYQRPYYYQYPYFYNPYAHFGQMGNNYSDWAKQHGMNGNSHDNDKHMPDPNHNYKGSGAH